MYIREHGYYQSWDAYDNYLWTNGHARPPAATAEGAIALTIWGIPVEMPPPATGPEFRQFRQAINAYVDFLEDRDEFGTESGTAEEVSADFAAAALLWETRREATAE